MPNASHQTTSVQREKFKGRVLSWTEQTHKLGKYTTDGRTIQTQSSAATVPVVATSLERCAFDALPSIFHLRCASAFSHHHPIAQRVNLAGTVHAIHFSAQSSTHGGRAWPSPSSSLGLCSSVVLSPSSGVSPCSSLTGGSHADAPLGHVWVRARVWSGRLCNTCEVKSTAPGSEAICQQITI